MIRGTRAKYVGQADDSPVETLKTEVSKSIARALELNAQRRPGVLGLAQKSAVNFYEQVTHFEVELLRQALVYTNGNQRAAARLLGLKPTTLNNKVKTHNLD